jgi:hypothetical protein
MKVSVDTDFLPTAAVWSTERTPWGGAKWHLHPDTDLTNGREVSYAVSPERGVLWVKCGERQGRGHAFHLASVLVGDPDFRKVLNETGRLCDLATSELSWSRKTPPLEHFDNVRRTWVYEYRLCFAGG